ncbi:MAG: hypothetical protein RTV72_17310, partial [Candidatus Thorarchaeota archaeon]
MDSNQTKLLTIVIIAVVISGGAMAALILMQPGASTTTDNFVEIIGTGDTSQNVTLSDMIAMEAVTGNSSYQNTYGNVKGNGSYTGVKISDIIDLVGGMGEDYILRVVAEDDYSHSFERAKV